MVETFILGLGLQLDLCLWCRERGCGGAAHSASEAASAAPSSLKASQTSGHPVWAEESRRLGKMTQGWDLEVCSKSGLASSLLPS